MQSNIDFIPHRSSGRLMYQMGETEQAVRLFLGLLKESLPISVSSDLNFGTVAQGSTEADTDRTFLEDFRLAFEVREPTESLPNIKLIFCSISLRQTDGTRYPPTYIYPSNSRNLRQSR